jgi:3-oxoacyl-[acyl-carrier-protein] synthase II
MRRVVVTGVGLATPLGVEAGATWEALLAGRSAVAKLRGFDPASLHCQLAAEMPDFDAKPYVANKRALRMMTRADQLAVSGATLAVRDSGRDPAKSDPERAGLFVGGNKETSKLEPVLDGLRLTRREDGSADLLKLGAEVRSVLPPLFFVEGLQAASLFYVSEPFGMKGANTYFSGQAESGALAVARAFRTVRRGEADWAIAGGFDDATSWWNMTRYDAMGFLTERNELGAAACRPFDRKRTGTVLGEGAAFLLLEDYDQAKARGARIRAEVVGAGSGYDNAGVLSPDRTGRGVAQAVAAALREAGASPGDVGYVAAHGSGTALGDRTEARGLRQVFGASGGPAGSSVKAATGHMMAAAGALNVAVAALALESQSAPPTLNLDDIDRDCAMDWVRGGPRKLDTSHAVAVARGLFGHNIALALRAVRPE